MNEKYGRLTVIGEAPRVQRRRMVVCRCECGTEKIHDFYTLKKGLSKSCGCLRTEMIVKRSTIHGHATRDATTGEYYSYRQMLFRCFDPSYEHFQDYGGRGITVFEPWRTDFALFLSHIGEKPTPAHSIDRINNDGNYEPGNVRWATRVEQCSNRRNSVFLECNGKRQTIPQWSRETGIGICTIRYRLAHGKTAQEALQ